jgi:hypothetical protein
MRCERFERRLQQLLDRRLRPEEDEDLLLHAAVCTTCQLWLAAQKSLYESLRWSRPPQLGRTFAQRVLARSSRARTVTRWRAVVGSAVVIAASLLIVTMPVGWNPNGGRRAQPMSSVKRAPSQGAVVHHIELPSGVRKTHEPAPMVEIPVDHLAMDAEAIRDVWNKWVRSLSESPLDGLEPVDQITRGFRPLASTLNVAIDALRSTVPVGKDTGPAEPQAHAPHGQRVLTLS